MNIPMADEKSPSVYRTPQTATPAAAAAAAAGGTESSTNCTSAGPGGSQPLPPPAQHPSSSAQYRERQLDEFSTTNTESLVNGSSAAVNLLDHIDEIKPHPNYLLPPKVTHPLEDNFGWVFLRGCAFHLAGLLVGLPLFAFILVCVCIVCPIRVLLWLLGSLLPFCAPLRRLAALSQHSCHIWWPLSTHASPHASLVQCIVTLQSPIDVDDARRQISENVFCCETTGAGDATAAAAGDDIEMGSVESGGAYNRRIVPGQQGGGRGTTMLERLVGTPGGGTGASSASSAQHIRRDYIPSFTRLPGSLEHCCRPRQCNLPGAQQQSTSGGHRTSVTGGGGGKTTNYVYRPADHIAQTHVLSRNAPAGSASAVGSSDQQLIVGGGDAASSTASVQQLNASQQLHARRRSRIASLSGLSERNISQIVDLESYVNYPTMKWSKRKPAWGVKLLPQFGNVDEGTCCALVLIEMQSRLSDRLCPLRFLSLWTDGHLTFDVEPKYRRSFLFGGVLPPYNVFLTVSYALWTVCQAVCASPLCLLIGALRQPEPVWSYSPTGASFSRHGSSGGGVGGRAGKLREAGSVLSTANRRYRGVSTVTNGSGGPGTDRRQSCSLASSALIGFGLAPSHKRVTWARISNMDQLLRAERILRASTVELLLAFVAGALRRHFRSQGIRHPPSVRIAVPVSNRDFMPVSQLDACDFVLVPVNIPVGIEGNIPRIWAVQRSLADALDEPFPLGARLARFFGKLLVPEWAAARVQRQTYNDTACAVSFIRASGDASLHSRRIHSVLCYSPVPDDCRAAFGFIQCGTEMVVTLTADTRLFVEPDTLLAFFQAEVLSLLRQLSVRLLTLTQATYLPPCQMQQTAAQPATPSTCDESPLGEDSCSSVSVPLTPSVMVEPCAGAGGGPPPDFERPATSIEPMVTTPLSQQQLHAHDQMINAAHGVGGARQRSLSRSSRTSRSLFMEVGRLVVPVTQTRRSSASGNGGGDPNETASLEELEALLATVQHELDTMKANPQGDRGEYVAKLAELEQKMEDFHKTIARRLGPQLTAAAEASASQPNIAVVDEMLAPYREEERALAERRMSRDSRRSSINLFANRMIRKRSSTRRLDSPTRRMSPRGSTCSLQPDEL